MTQEESNNTPKNPRFYIFVKDDVPKSQIYHAYNVDLDLSGFKLQLESLINTAYKKDFPSTYSFEKQYKVYIRTTPGNWVNTAQDVIIPFSIHSHIYKDDLGKIKIKAFLKLLKMHVKGKKTVLFCEKAHINVMSIGLNGNMGTMQICNQDAQKLKETFLDDLKGFDVSHWEDFVEKDIHYISVRDFVYKLFETDDVFKLKVKNDAKETYNPLRKKEFPDMNQYLNKCELDLLERCIFLLIASRKGYKFEFYPGKRSSCAQYINSQYIEESAKLTSVNVSIHTPEVCR